MQAAKKQPPVAQIQPMPHPEAPLTGQFASSSDHQCRLLVQDLDCILVHGAFIITDNGNSEQGTSS